MYEGPDDLDMDSEERRVYKSHRRILPRRRPRRKANTPPARSSAEAKPTRYKSKRRRFRKLKIGVIVTAVLVVAIILTAFIWGSLWLKSKEKQMHDPAAEAALDETESGEAVNTLIIGVDRGSVEGEGGPGRSDILMLACQSGDGDTSAVVSIPRDTRVSIPGHGYQKINSAHMFGGIPGALDAVRRLTGLKIQHFIEIDFEGFKRIVNAIGGIRVDVPVAIHDKYAGDVPAGNQVLLNGDQALALVRARYDLKSVPGGDLDRVKNQRKVLQAMLSQVSAERNPWKIRDVVDAVADNMKTDLSFWGMLGLGRSLKGSDGVKMETAPGTTKTIGRTWYFVVDQQQLDRMLAPFMSGASSGAYAELSEGEGSSEEAGDVERSDVSVEVLNGSGRSGLAARVSGVLAGKGYHMSSSGNAKSAYGTTTIYYASGDLAKARAVAGDLSGAGEAAVKENDALTARHGVDVLVVLGSDYGG